MKTLMTAALLTGLTLADFARAEEPVKNPEVGSAKSPTVVKKLTPDELRGMLETMGYELKPIQDNAGKLVGYTLTMERAGTTIYCSLGVSASGESIWLYGTLVHTADANTPAEALLAMLALNFDIAPASICYNPQTKKFAVSVIVPNSGVTPAGLRSALNFFATGVSQALTTWDKAIAKAKEGGKTAPSPLP